MINILELLLGKEKEIHFCRSCNETVMMRDLEKHIKEYHFWN